MSKNLDKPPNLSKEKINIIKNSFPIQQVKKMIGKKLIVPLPSLTVTVQEKNSAKLIKTKLLDVEINKNEKSTTKKKNLILTAMCNNGVLYVFKNIDMFLAINSISYKELNDGVGDNITVIIHQYPKLTKTELKNFM
jgi:hypothetical protein